MYLKTKENFLQYFLFAFPFSSGAVKNQLNCVENSIQIYLFITLFSLTSPSLNYRRISSILMTFASNYNLYKFEQIVSSNYISISYPNFLRWSENNYVAFRHGTPWRHRRRDIFFFSSSGFAAPNYKYHSMTIIHRKNKYLFWKIQ